MDVTFRFSSPIEAEPLIKAKLKVRPTLVEGSSCQVRVLNLVKVEQNGLRIFPGTVYKEKEGGTMFTASDPDSTGHQKIRMIT